MQIYDALADAERHIAEQERQLEQRPVCAECGEHIQDDHLYEIGGEILCCDCTNLHYRKYTEDYIK